MDQSHSNTIETSLNYLYMLMKVLVSLGIIVFCWLDWR